MSFEELAADAWPGLADALGGPLTWSPAAGGTVSVPCVPDEELLEELAHGRSAALVTVFDVPRGAVDGSAGPTIARGDGLKYEGRAYVASEVLPLDSITWRIRARAS